MIIISNASSAIVLSPYFDSTWPCYTYLLL